MSLNDAKRVLQWNVVTAALTEAGVDAETLAMVEHAQHVSDIVYSFARMLMGSADAKQPKNYVKVEMVGFPAPFDRAYVELVRPGGKTSHELRELLRGHLEYLRGMLATGASSNSSRNALISGIDETLAKEAP